MSRFINDPLTPIRDALLSRLRTRPFAQERPEVLRLLEAQTPNFNANLNTVPIAPPDMSLIDDIMQRINTYQPPNFKFDFPKLFNLDELRAYNNLMPPAVGASNSKIFNDPALRILQTAHNDPIPAAGIDFSNLPWEFASPDISPVQFSKRLDAFLKKAKEVGHKINIFSGYRSITKQKELWDKSDKTGKMVAQPGYSMHNWGLAGDLKYGSNAAKGWAHKNAEQFGLYFPMSFEPWHIQLAGTDKRTKRGDIGKFSPNPEKDQPVNLDGLSPALRELIMRESSGKVTADNPKSSAFGLGQLIKSNRILYAGKLGISNPDTTDPQEQLAMMMAYIKDRYGTPEKALAFWKSRQPINGKDVGNWY